MCFFSVNRDIRFHISQSALKTQFMFSVFIYLVCCKWWYLSMFPFHIDAMAIFNCNAWLYRMHLRSSIDQLDTQHDLFSLVKVVLHETIVYFYFTFLFNQM